jgi:hypothetical protein
MCFLNIKVYQKVHFYKSEVHFYKSVPQRLSSKRMLVRPRGLGLILTTSDHLDDRDSGMRCVFWRSHMYTLYGWFIRRRGSRASVCCIRVKY